MSAKILIMSNKCTMHLFDNLQDPYLQSIKSELVINEFSDNEIEAAPRDSIRGSYVYLFAGCGRFTLVDLIASLDSLQRSSVYKVVVILPYYGFSRQDKRKNTRGSLMAKRVANIISDFPIVQHILTMDIHADQIKGFFDIPMDSLLPHTIFGEHLKQYVTESTVVSGTDAGGAERSRELARVLDCGLVQIDKVRKKANEVEKMTLIGDVTGKDVILVDDIGDTFGTILKAEQLLLDKGANSVIVVITHPVLSGDAMYKIVHLSQAKKIFISDTINNIPSSSKVEVVSCLPILEKAILNIMAEKSVSELNL